MTKATAKIKSAKPIKKAAKSAAKKEVKSVARREGAVASWANKKVAKARTTRHHVRAGGVEYRSLAAAFEDLKLAAKEHVKNAFRVELKAAGRKAFTDDKGKRVQFSIVQ